MYSIPTRSSYLRRSLLVNHERDQLIKASLPYYQEERIKDELIEVGASRHYLKTMEARYLPHIIHPDEHICGVVFGLSVNGLVMLLATDRRVVYLDKELLFVNEDEISFDSVSGVNFAHLGLGSTVTLHTRVKDYIISTLNLKAARTFVDYIEERCLSQKKKGS